MIMLTLLCSVSSVAFATETQSVETLEIDETGFVELSIDDWNYVNGSFVTISDLGLSMWLPDGFTEDELTEDELEKQYLAKVSDEYLELSIATVGVECDYLTAWYDYIVQKGFSNPMFAEINGIDAVLYNVPAMDLQVVSFLLTNKDILEFYFTPVSDPENQDVIRAMICSIDVI